ncbi:MAG: amidohydrolase family protein [Pseudomonadota bacterium]
MFDTLITGGQVVDGSIDAEPVTADVGISDGRIAAIGDLKGTAARQTIDADGALVTPAWVDIHTHYDGQVTWDDTLDPSASHGVGTIVMGNCGVGFAPVAPGGERDLIELMEGVEDIPGTALYEGMPWGSWNSYPEYLDLLASRRYSLDISSLIAHGAVRNFVMGERGRTNQAATEADMQAMSGIVEAALRAGAVGFSTSRILGHRSIQGEPVPGTFANDAEILLLAQALKRAGSGVFQMIPSSTLGAGNELAVEHSSLEQEIALMKRISLTSGRPLTFTLFQVDDWADKWRDAIARCEEANAEGAQIYPQVGSRPTGLVMSLRTYHPFMLKPTWKRLAELPWAERLAALRQPQNRTAILSEANVDHPHPGSMEFGIANIDYNFDNLFPISGHSTYEPDRSDSLAARAAREGYTDEMGYLYDYLVDGDGDRFVILFFTNYSRYNLDAVREMQLSPTTVTGLSDAGAHVSLIFDAVNPTYQLTYWGRDRERGPTLPLPYLIHRQTARNAALFGFADRGLVREGLRADLNVIDFDRLALEELELRSDLPAGGTRLMQGAKGYVATLVNGAVTRRNGADTGARPGRLKRGAGAG